jgi:hypothetical protein
MRSPQITYFILLNHNFLANFGFILCLGLVLFTLLYRLFSILTCGTVHSPLTNEHHNIYK